MRLSVALLAVALASPALASQPGQPLDQPQTAGAPPTASADQGMQATRLDTVWVDGHAFEVAASEEFTAAMNLVDGDYLEGNVFITNTSNRPFTFDPAQIDAMAWKTSRKGQVKKIGIYTYPADEYVAELRGQANFRKAMVAFGYGLRSAGGHLSAGSQPGDRAVADSVQRVDDDLNRQEAAGIGARIDEKVAIETDGLMRKHTIFPGQTYGGRVMFGNANGDSWEFDMQLGAKRFVFKFK